MNQATQTQTQTLEQALNKTDFGHMLFENRRIFLGLILAVLVGITGWALWRESKKSSALDHSVKVFEFQSRTWSEVKAGNFSSAELLAVWGKLPNEVKTAPVMLPLVLEMGKFLYEKGEFQQAESILSQVDGAHSHPIPHFFLSLQRAVVLEKMGKLDEAIGTLEKLAKSKEPILPAKVSAELGRLYLTKGEKGKAQTKFEHVLATYPNDDHAKLAKLYLSQLH